AVPGRLSVPDQEHARRQRLAGDGELRRLRARGSDLDAYTNFLSNPDRPGRSQEKAVAVARHVGRNPPSLAFGVRSGRAVHRYPYRPQWERAVRFAVLPVRASFSRPGG